MNRLYPTSKQNEGVTRKLIKYFAEERPIEYAAKKTGLSEKSVSRTFIKIRERLSEHFNELHRYYFDDVDQKAFTRNLLNHVLFALTYENEYETVDRNGAYILGRKREKPLFEDGYINKHFYEGLNNSETEKRITSEAVKIFLSSLKAEEEKFYSGALEMHRGVSNEHMLALMRENSYRTTILHYTCVNRPIDHLDPDTDKGKEPVDRVFSINFSRMQGDGSIYIEDCSVARNPANTFSEQVNKAAARTIEKHLLRLLMNYPLQAERHDTSVAAFQD